jgi:hypothetical protein
MSGMDVMGSAHSAEKKRILAPKSQKPKIGKQTGQGVVTSGSEKGALASDLIDPSPNATFKGLFKSQQPHANAHKTAVHKRNARDSFVTRSATKGPKENGECFPTLFRHHPSDFNY